MVTQTETTFPILPEFARQPVADIAATVAERLKSPLKVPLQEVAGLSPTQVSAMNLAQQGIGSFQPFLQAAQAAQTAGLGTIGAGAQTVAGAEFVPTEATLDRFRDPYQMDVTREALKEIDRQQQIAENRLAGQAVRAGAFGGSRFGVAQSELARNAADLKSRRIFEDLSRNFQQAQAAARAANQQRLQAGQVFGQLGRATSGIGGAMAGLGAQQQALQGRDVGQLLGIGGLQQQQAQRQLDVNTANLAAIENAPFQQLSAGAGILQQLPGIGGGSQVVAPLAQTNPYLQAAGAVGALGTGLGALIGN
ncbi:hypothetical protein OA003_00220 [bacterium]|nr:hypothetical protein [bacterium]